MHSTLRVPLLVLLGLSACALALASVNHDAPARLERRSHPKKSKEAKGSDGHLSSGPSILGNPDIRCEVPDIPNWTIELDPIDTGCYEGGKQITVNWKIVDKGPGIPAQSPVISFLVSRLGKQVGETAPATTLVKKNHDHGVSLTPVCAVNGSAKITIPGMAVGFKEEDLYPKNTDPWALLAINWIDGDKDVYIPNIVIVQAPGEPGVPSKFSDDNQGFLIAPKGGCKGYKALHGAV